MKTCGTWMGLERHEHFEAVLLCYVFFSVFCNSFINDKMIIKNVDMFIGKNIRKLTLTN